MEWNGWKTGRAANALWSLMGGSLVASQVVPYKSAWLFGLSLAWKLEIFTAELEDCAAEAAFLPSELIAGESLPKRQSPWRKMKK